MPSVATNGVTRAIVMTNPLTNPTAAASSRHTITAGSMFPGLPPMRLVETMFAIVTTPATERSIPPVNRAIVWPVATTPRNAATWKMFIA